MDFDIPTDLTHLWRYMYHMYHLDAFTQSCPADQDIINHYKLQQVPSISCWLRLLFLVVVVVVALRPFWEVDGMFR